MRYNILKFEWEKIDVAVEWWKSTKISKKGPKRYAKAYVGRPISAHHDTPWALSAVDVAGFMVIDSAYSSTYIHSTTCIESSRKAEAEYTMYL